MEYKLNDNHAIVRIVCGNAKGHKQFGWIYSIEINTFMELLEYLRTLLKFNCLIFNFKNNSLDTYGHLIRLQSFKCSLWGFSFRE